MDGRKKVLQDHTKQGKTFLPPFTHKLGPLQEVSWFKTILPELLWIAHVQEYHGLREGVRLITALSRSVHKCSPSEKKRVFAAVSSFVQLTPDEKSSVRVELAEAGDLFPIQKALTRLIVFYPQCPLGFLYSKDPELSGNREQNLRQLKILVAGLYDKASRDAMMVQASAIWLAFDSDVLKVFEGLALANFPEIENYPRTELSQKVGGSIRASINVFFGQPFYQASAAWPRYFWNRGLEIDKCYFEETSNV
jgi:hypothetical protein